MSDMSVTCLAFGSAIGCRFGNKCRFNHNNPNSVPLCKYFTSPNGCYAGNSCHWRHYSSQHTDTTNNNDDNMPICRYFNMDGCNRGFACKFKHIKKEKQKIDKSDSIQLELKQVKALLKDLKSVCNKIHDDHGYVMIDFDDSTFSPIQKFMENISRLMKTKQNIAQKTLYFPLQLCDFLMKSKRILHFQQESLINKWNFDLNEYIYSAKQIDECVANRFIAQCRKNKIPDDIMYLCFLFYHQNDYFKFISHCHSERSKNKKTIVSNNDEYVMSFGSLLFMLDASTATDINLMNQHCWQFKIISGGKTNVCIGMETFEELQKSFSPETDYDDYYDESYMLCNDGGIHNPYCRRKRTENKIYKDLVFEEGDIVCMSFKFKEGMLGFYVINDKNNDRKIKYNYVFNNIPNDKIFRMAVGLEGGSVQLI